MDLQVKEVMERVNQLWQNSDFEGALSALKSAYECLPDNVAIAFEYGHMLGEMSSRKHLKWREERRLEAIEVLGRLCGNLDGIDPLDQWKFRRHYYLYAGKHLANRELGYEEIKRGNQMGLLSVGFGCLHHAIELVDKQKQEEAQSYAAEGESAFEQLLRADAPKYGRLLAYALTLSIVGENQEALDATAKAAEMIGIDSNLLREHYEEMNRLLSMSCHSLR